MIFIITDGSITKLGVKKFTSLRHNAEKKSIELYQELGGKTEWTSEGLGDNTDEFRRLRKAIINDRWWKRTIVYI